MLIFPGHPTYADRLELRIGVRCGRRGGRPGAPPGECVLTAGGCCRRRHCSDLPLVGGGNFRSFARHFPASRTRADLDTGTAAAASCCAVSHTFLKCFSKCGMWHVRPIVHSCIYRLIYFSLSLFICNLSLAMTKSRLNV